MTDCGYNYKASDRIALSESYDGKNSASPKVLLQRTRSERFASNKPELSLSLIERSGSLKTSKAPKKRRNPYPNPLQNCAALISEVKTDRSEWKARVMEIHPEIRELRERIYTLHRASRFVSIFQPACKTSGEGLTEKHIIQLIMQHMHYYGLHSALRTLKQESGQDCILI